MAYNELYNDQRRYIISGWVSWSWYWLLYDVSSIEYFFDWLKTSLQTQVTLNNWDTNYNRFDVITVDEYGTIYLIEWIPEENPLIPIIPDDQILVQYILVEANTTEPNIIQDAIYLDNGEWATSTYTSWSTWSSIDFNNSSIVKQGTLSVFGNTDKLMWARFVRTTAIDAQMFTVITMWVYLPTVIPTTRSLNVRFENSAWALVGNTVNLFSYWVNKSIAWQRQLAIVPISVFWAITNVKWLKILLAWWTNLVYNEWYIDYIMLSWGIPPQANVPTITAAKNGVNVGTQSTINLIEWVWVTIDAVNNPLYNRVDYTINSSGGGTPITIGTSGNTLYSSGFSNTGEGDTTIGQNIFLGDFAGGLSNSVSYSNLFGFGAGYGISGSIQHMNVFGRLAGLQANNSANSNFIGVFAGWQSTNSANSNFIGADAGNSADQSFCANFIGSGAGAQSKNSAFSNFIGCLSGNNMIWSYGNDSIFIGTSAGAGDNLSNYGEISYSSLSGTFTVGEEVSSSSGGSAYIMFDNGTDLRVANVQGDFNISDTITDGGGATANLDYFSTSKASILIGNNTSTGDYYNSIAIGNGATNTANNEIVIESTKGLENLKLKLDHTQQSAVTFTGSGLDDLTVSGTFSGTYPTTYTVTVASSGTPDTFDWTDGTNSGTGVSMSTSPTLLSNGISITFGADNGHTLTESWTWDYTSVNQNVLDFSNNDYKFQSTFGKDTFGYQISENLLGLGYEGSAMTLSDGSGNSGFRGLYIETGKGDIYVADNITLSDGTIVENKIDISSTASVTYAYNGTSFLTGTSVIASDYINIYNDVGAGNELGFFVESGTLLLGNRNGGNNTKITIDDVNEQITISNLSAYDDDTAAGVGGLTAGMVYMTTGSGSAPLNAAGILMIKQ